MIKAESVSVDKGHAVGLGHDGHEEHSQLE